MQRRTFLKSLFGTVATWPLLNLTRKSAAVSNPRNCEVLIQTSPVAGFRFYDGELLWKALRTGDEVQLISEQRNPYDSRAVKVMWGNNQLGYVPRKENATVFQMLNREQNIHARIAELKDSADPWERVTIDIYLLQG